MKLEDIGFVELIEDRAKNIKPGSISYCEWLITANCNFNCPYCNRLSGELAIDPNTNEAKSIIDILAGYNLKYLHLTGGEPTTRKDLSEIIKYAKSKNIRVGLSTNGSRTLDYYQQIVSDGVEYFSISLDIHRNDLNKHFTNVDNIFDQIVLNIKELSRVGVNVTVGITFTDMNISFNKEIIQFVSDLGAADIRIMTAANFNQLLKFDLSESLLVKHPILRYRVNNYNLGLNMRGSHLGTSSKCYLVIDDVSIVGKYHFPCAVYAREKGKPIGKISSSMNNERLEWFKTHNCHTDSICKAFCMDFKCRFNEKVEGYIKQISNPIS
jgi:MoaA/NifB/PqqE/SkfB family radical SAM enzyme